MHEKRLEGLFDFSVKKPLNGIFAVWKNPITNRLNRLTPRDIYYIDWLQREFFDNHNMLSIDRRAYFEKRFGFKLNKDYKFMQESLDRLRRLEAS
jgi:hypothetical protein